jgi:hypothetical protein
MNSWSHRDEEQILEEHLDALAAGETPSSELDPVLGSLVATLSEIPFADWDRVAPVPTPITASTRHHRNDDAGRPARPASSFRSRSRTSAASSGRRTRFERPRPAFVAAAAATFVAALLIGIGSLMGNHSGPGTTDAASWRLQSFLAQPGWQAPVDSTSLASQTVVCPVPKRCYATEPGGTTVELSVDGGVTWTPENLPSSSTLSTGLACLTPQECLAGGSAPSAAAVRAPTAPGFGQEGGTAPAAGSRDPALSSRIGGGETATSVGGTEVPSIFGTADGGGTWSTTPLPASSGTVVDVSCFLPQTCLAVVNLTSGGATTGGPDAAVYLSSDGGQTWSAGGSLPPSFEPAAGQGIDCTTQSCVMVGASGDDATTAAAAVSTDGGQSWTGVTVPGALALLTSISCNQTSCVAVGKTHGNDSSTPYGPSAVITSDDAGATWSSSAAVGLASTDLWSLTCEDSGDCWVAGMLLGQPSPAGFGYIASTTDGGSTWSNQPLPTTPSAAQQAATGLTQLNFPVVTSISCPDDSCVALASQSSLSQPDLRQAVLATA